MRPEKQHQLIEGYEQHTLQGEQASSSSCSLQLALQSVQLSNTAHGRSARACSPPSQPCRGLLSSRTSLGQRRAHGLKFAQPRGLPDRLQQLAQLGLLQRTMTSLVRGRLRLPGRLRFAAAALQLPQFCVGACALQLGSSSSCDWEHATAAALQPSSVLRGRLRLAGGLEQLVWLEAVAHDGALGVAQELVLALLAVVHARHLRAAVQVPHEPERVHVLRARAHLRSARARRAAPASGQRVDSAPNCNDIPPLLLCFDTALVMRATRPSSPAMTATARQYAHCR